MHYYVTLHPNSFISVCSRPPPCPLSSFVRGLAVPLLRYRYHFSTLCAPQISEHFGFKNMVLKKNQFVDVLLSPSTWEITSWNVRVIFIKWRWKELILKMWQRIKLKFYSPLLRSTNQKDISCSPLVTFCLQLKIPFLRENNTLFKLDLCICRIHLAVYIFCSAHTGFMWSVLFGWYSTTCKFVTIQQVLAILHHNWMAKLVHSIL